ncbi:YueH family protein [Lentibacillus sediminis]|uniref:YueH family protein n=1 Tax=Lentibacillus sediminis TaxID=1940529 RepID=UPI000C1BA369|nr:YueH family protein [Lentibacillus sediminis]
MDCQLNIKNYEVLKKHFGNVDVYYTDMEDQILVSIPVWNFSYLWNMIKNDNEAKQECLKALSLPMLEEHAIELSNHIYHYIQWGQ